MDPLYRGRRTLHTGEELLTDRQRDRLRSAVRRPRARRVEATWGSYQRMLTAYRHPDRATGKTLLQP